MLNNPNWQPWKPGPLATLQPTDWIALFAVVAVAIVSRVWFYTGFFGSDEVTYIDAAARIASGDWRASNYIGATRYGMNLPLALSIYLLGLSEGSVNLWPFLCSVGEVAVVFIVARWLWSTRVAIICAGLLALLPLHVHLAGRMLADAPLAFFLSLSVALLLQAAASRRLLVCFAAGLAWGGVFWVKESVGLLYLPVFLFLSILLSGFSGRWLALLGGIGLAVTANCVLMNYVAGNPMHVFATMKQAVLRVNSLPLETSPWFYFRYLLFDIRHTLLLGHLAAAGCIVYIQHLVRGRLTAPSTQFVVWWVLLLIGMFSFAVVSFNPVKLVMKQHNYMLIFVGPMALLGGWFLALLPRRIFLPLGALIVTGSVVLAALEQQAITVFTANSKAAYLFLRDHPNAHVVGTANNERAVNYFSMMERLPEVRSRVSSLGDMAAPEHPNSLANLATKTAGQDVFAVLDLQTVDWNAKPGGIRRISEVPKCWMPRGTLPPAALGSGQWIAKGIVAAGAFLPDGLQQRFKATVQPISVLAPAYLFEIDRECLIKPRG